MKRFRNYTGKQHHRCKRKVGTCGVDIGVCAQETLVVGLIARHVVVAVCKLRNKSSNCTLVTIPTSYACQSDEQPMS